MKLQIKVIRFVFFSSLALAFFTYLITLNIENEYLVMSSPWISNNFALTVVGGAFASMLVVLLCEIQKYFEMKRTAEKRILVQCISIYIRLDHLKKQVEELLSKPDRVIPKGILSFATEALKNDVSEFIHTDYHTFSTTMLEVEFNKFCNVDIPKIQEFILYENYLSIAINTDQIDHLTVHKVEGIITSASPKTKSTLEKYRTMLESRISDTVTFFKRIESLCGKKYIDQNANDEHNRHEIKLMPFEEFTEK